MFSEYTKKELAGLAIIVAALLAAAVYCYANASGETYFM